NGLEKMLGPNRKMLVILTADHGAGVPVPKAQKNNLPSGQWDETKIKSQLEKCIGKTDVVDGLVETNIFLKSNGKDVETLKKAKDCVSEAPGVWYAFTRDEIMENKIPQTPWTKNLAASYFPSRGADIVAVLMPYWN